MKKFFLLFIMVLGLLWSPAQIWAQGGDTFLRGGALAKERKVYTNSIIDTIDLGNQTPDGEIKKDSEKHRVVPSIPVALPQAEAGINKFALIGKQVIFDGSLSRVPAGLEQVDFVWDFGDGVIGKGVRVVHIYDKAGDYKVRLTISIGDYQSIDELVVSVFEKQVVLLSDPKFTASDLSDFNSKIRTEKVDIRGIHLGGNYPSRFIAEDVFVKKIIKSLDDFTSSEYIFSSGFLGARSLANVVSQVPLDLTHKKLIILTSSGNVYWYERKFAKLLLEVLDVESVVFVPPDFKFKNLLNNKYDNFTIIEQSHGVSGPLTMLQFFSNGMISLLQSGYSLHVLYFLMSMLLIGLMSIMARKLLGLNVMDVFSLGLSIVSILYLGIFPGVSALCLFLIVSFFLKHMFSFRYITSFPWSMVRYAGIVVVTIVGSIFVVVFYRESVAWDWFFPLLILAYNAEMLSHKLFAKGPKEIAIILVQNIGFVLAVSLILQSSALEHLLLAFPEMSLAIIVILAFLIDRYSGLRLLEFKYFRSILKRSEEVI